jgi:hypothetical protein
VPSTSRDPLSFTSDTKNPAALPPGFRLACNVILLAAQSVLSAADRALDLALALSSVPSGGVAMNAPFNRHFVLGADA